MRRNLVRIASLGMALALLVPATASAAPNRGIQSVSATFDIGACEMFTVLASAEWAKRRADAITLELRTSTLVLDAETMTLSKPASSGSWSAQLVATAPASIPVGVRVTLWLKGVMIDQLSTTTTTCIA